MTLNQLLMHSVYTAVSEANDMTWTSKEERNEWEGKRTNEVFEELKAKYIASKP